MYTEIVRITLPLYFILYFGYIFIYKSKLIAKKIDKDPMVLPKDDSAYGLIGTYFKLLHYLILIYTITFGKIMMPLNKFGFVEDKFGIS